MSSDSDRITAALDRLEQVQADLSTISARTDDRRRADLVNLRRQLSDAIAHVGEVANPVVTRRCDADDQRLYRAKFSAMRSATALHQANWPAVTLDDAPDQHRESARGVRVANHDFVAWMRALLLRLP